MATVYVQKIFDTGLNQYVRYQTVLPTNSPNPADTVPVGVGPFDISTHTIELVYDNPNQDYLGGMPVDTPLAIGVGEVPEWDGASFTPGTGGGGGFSEFVWRPGVPPDSPTTFNTWAALYAAVSAVPPEFRKVHVDSGAASATVDVGTWDLSDWVFIGQNGTGYLSTVEFPEGSHFTISSPTTNRVPNLSLTNMYVVYTGTTSPCYTVALPNSRHFILVGSEIDATGGQPFVDSTAGFDYVILQDSYVWAPPGDQGVFRFTGTAFAQVYFRGYSGDNTGAWAGAGPASLYLTSQSASSGIWGQPSYGGSYPSYTGFLAVTLQEDAGGVRYWDTVAPVLGVSDVQAAIDAIKPLLSPAATAVTYSDAVLPPLGAVTVQAAIDAIKPLLGGSGFGSTMPSYGSLTKFNEEFLLTSTTSPYEGLLHAVTSGTGAAVTPQTGSLDGSGLTLFCFTGTDTTGFSGVSTSPTNGYGTIMMGTGIKRFRQRIRINTLSDGTDTFHLYSGMFNTGTLSNPTTTDTGAFFYYSHGLNAGKFLCIHNGTANGSQDSGITVTAFTEYTLEAEVNATGTQARFWINGVLVATVNIAGPTTNPVKIVPVGIKKQLGTSGRGVYLFGPIAWNNEFTTPF